MNGRDHWANVFSLLAFGPGVGRASALLVCAVAFVPLVFGMKHLYFWANAEKVAAAAEHTQHLMHHKAPYLNTSMFIMRVSRSCLLS